MIKSYLLLFVLLSTSSVHALDAIQEELSYQHYQASILAGENPQYLIFNETEQSLLVDALWDLSTEGNEEALKMLKELETFHFSPVERFRVALLRLEQNLSQGIPREIIAEILNSLQMPQPSLKLINLIAAHETEIVAAGHQELVAAASQRQEFYSLMRDDAKNLVIDKFLVKDLVKNSPALIGEYKKGVKIFMFCRKNRDYPCLMLMQDSHGKLVRNANGSLWTHKALAAAATGFPSYKRNGNTPAGIFTLDGVMPVADRQSSFGKFRRIILSFVPSSPRESEMKELLPRSSHSSKWWQPSVTARDVGRNLFRIHGTGRKNDNSRVPWFPFMKTHGCIAQRENTYRRESYEDQRILLESILKAMRIKPTYSNQSRIKGILYLMDIDGLNKAVSLDDLKNRGIN